jgi:WD40-like Beta Propeller Repeat
MKPFGFDAVPVLPTRSNATSMFASHTSGRDGSAAGLRRRPLLGRVVAVLVAVVATGVAALGLGAASARAGECPNAVLRAQNSSTGLPDCRAYELVTNPFKEGFAPYLYSYSDDGALSYTSNGNFAENGLGASSFNQYVATRTPTGWTTTALAPSGPGYMNDDSKARAMSADLRSSIWQMRLPEQPSNIDDLYLRGPDGAFTRIGSGPNPATLPPRPPGTQPITDVTDAKVLGASADLSHVIFTVQPGNGYPGDTAIGQNSSLYEYVGTGNDRPRLVGVDNNGHQLGHGDTCGDGISTDGRVVFFDPGCLTASGSSRVWARINGVTSIEASASECNRPYGDPAGVCNGPAPAVFAGAASDGSRVFFTTSQQLVNGDTDTTDDLYACDIPAGTPAPVGAANPCAGLRQVSGPDPGAGVESVAAVSKDGSKVYFVAQGVLATNDGVNDVAAVAGDHNLYLWQQDAAHPTGLTTFVARLDTNDIAVPSAPYMSADGRYLAFTSSTQLVTSGPGTDTDTAVDLYRYDAQSGAILRLSTDTTGSGGNEPGLDATLSARGEGPGSTAVTANGDTVVFISNEALSPDDVNGDTDVYAWHDGQVSLISSGRPSLINSQVPFGAVTPLGTDIFFSSTEQLTPADGDTNPDIYDARIDGGFDFTPPSACSGDECQGRPGAAPVAGVPRSGAPIVTADATPVFSVRAVSAAQRKHLAQTGKLTMTVTANTPGVVSATTTATISGKVTSVGSARRTMLKAGATTLALVLAKKARTQLTTDGKLIVKVVVSASKVAVTQPVTLKLTHAKKRTVRNDRGGRS